MVADGPPEKMILIGPTSSETNNVLPESATEEECWDYLIKNPDRLKHIPRSRRTNGMFHRVITSGLHSTIFDAEFKEEMTEELYIAAILRSHVADIFTRIPRRHITQLICDLACKSATTAQIEKVFSSVPDMYRTERLCNMVYQRNDHMILLIPPRYITKKMWLDTLKAKRITLSEIPEAVLDADMCVTAMRAAGSKLKLSGVPARFRTKELCEIAMGNDPKSFEFVPIELRTEELCTSVVKRYGEAIQHVPNQTRQQCEMAIDQDPHLIAMLDAEAQTEEIILRVLASARCHHLRADMIHNQTQATCVDIIYTHPMLICQIRQQTDTLCCVAVDRNPNALQYVRNQTEDICALAVRANPQVLQYVRNKTHRVCEIAIRGDCEPGLVPWTPELLAVAADHGKLSVLNHVQQTPRLCLGTYRRGRAMFTSILDESNRRYVVRVIVAEKLSALRALDMSTALLSEIVSFLDGADLFPRVTSARDKNTGRDSHLSRKRRWDVAARVKHWTP